jgi:hypothetical protein
VCIEVVSGDHRIDWDDPERRHDVGYTLQERSGVHRYGCHKLIGPDLDVAHGIGIGHGYAGNPDVEPRLPHMVAIRMTLNVQGLGFNEW